ncbi:hypothetical protein Tco_0576251 [Tanacetum coccineum]
MSGCSIDQKVKYIAGSFMFMMIEEFCPSHEMQKLEIELWNHAMVGAGHAAYTDTFHELARLVPHLICGIVAAKEPKTIQKAVQISGALTDEAVRNRSIKKVKKRGNVGESSKDKNGMDDNKRTRTGNAFTATVNPVGRENTGAWPKCTTCNSYHPGALLHNNLAQDMREQTLNVSFENDTLDLINYCYKSSTAKLVHS